MNGDLKLESAIGVGSKATFTLPLKQVAAPLMCTKAHNDTNTDSAPPPSRKMASRASAMLSRNEFRKDSEEADRLAQDAEPSRLDSSPANNSKLAAKFDRSKRSKVHVLVVEDK